MLFWQVIIFNMKTESTRQLCFPCFSEVVVDFLASWFFARKKLVCFPPIPHPLSQAKISVQEHPFKCSVLEKGEEKEL